MTHSQSGDVQAEGLPARRQRRRILFISILSAAPFIALAPLELFLTILWLQPPRGFSGLLFDEKDGLALVRPGVDGSQYGREFDVRIQGNEFGYRAGTWGDASRKAV